MEARETEDWVRCSNLLYKLVYSVFNQIQSYKIMIIKFATMINSSL